MDVKALLEKYYDKDSDLYRVLLTHSIQVRDKALQIVDAHPELNADREFVAEASMLHDIGIFMCHAPGIYCTGSHKYIEHGYLGAELLRNEGLPKHALVCERHTGSGLTLEHIVNNNLPLPHRNMVPVSIEEQIVCYADKFYSKSNLLKKTNAKEIARKLAVYGDDDCKRFTQWHSQFG